MLGKSLIDYFQNHVRQRKCEDTVRNKQADKDRWKYYYTGIGVALGVGVGSALGVALDNIAVGVAVGAGVGVMIGAVFSMRGRRG